MFEGILVIFFQGCFTRETQVLMTVSSFLDFFSRNHYLEGGFILQYWDFGGASFLNGEGFKKIIWMVVPPHAPFPH